MPQSLSARLASVALASVLLSTACRSITGATPLIQADGTVHRSVEGCFVIRTATQAFQPIALPAAFQIEGLAVHFEARSKPTPNICMAGDVVELLAIARLL